METRLSRICDALLEAGWLAALVVTPLFFNTFSNRVFEPDKLHLLRSIALVLAVVWAVQLLDRGFRRGGIEGAPGLWARVRATPLALPALILVATYLLSTLLSVVPRISFFGSYVRLQGTFSFLSYILIFAVVLTHLRSRDQLTRLFHTVILTSVPIAIYGIIQQAGLDPLPWGGDVIERVAANMGNAIFVAAYLIMAVFLTLERLLDSVSALFNTQHGSLADVLRTAAYLFILAIQLIAIVFTQSRGPQIGLLAGFYVFAMLGLLLLARWATGRARLPAALSWLTRNVRRVWWGLMTLTVAGVIFLGALNVPQGPFSNNLCKVRYIQRICTVASLTEGTNAVRALIWEGVVDMMLKPHAPIEWPNGQTDSLNVIRPLVGYGPESMWVAYNRFYPADLAHYESRNASPDRSHNETFDTLVRGGLLQFAAQIFLYTSVFYFALRWLGLLRGKGRRNLFVALLVAGGALGVIIPAIFDHSLRLAGIGLPVGLILGVIIYLTADLLLRGRTDITVREADPATRATDGRRQLTILALFAAIVAHFVEVHFGIAIAATLTHFWVLAAALVVVGMGWLDREPATEPSALPAPTPTSAAPQPAAAKAQPAGKHTAPTTKVQPGSQPARHKNAKLPPQPAQHSQPAMPPREPGALSRFWPYIGISALVTLVLTWDFIPQSVATGPQGAFAFLWDAFTVRTDAATYQIVRSPMLLVMLAFTWLLGGVLAVAEDSNRRRWGVSAASYLGASLGVWLVYGLIEAGRMDLGNLQGMAVFNRIAGHVVLFDVCLLLALIGLAAAVARAEMRPRPARWFGAWPALSLGGGLVLAGLALLIIINVNIQTVQADTYYKQGQGYEAAGQWEGAVILYREAALLEPQEDYYYLFLGRALLQLSEVASSGSALLPDNLNSVPTADLLGLVDQGVRAGTREDVMRAAYATLIGAQRLNPLNTDHTANLARLHRAWAFSDTAAATTNSGATALREILLTQPATVNAPRLDQAITYYRQATALSPQNAVLWNELTTSQIIRNDLAGAQTSLDRSLAVDQRYYPTYLLLGDLRDATGDKTGALAAFRRAAELAPNNLSVLSAVGVFSAQTGDAEGSLRAFEASIAVETRAIASLQNQLDQLDTRIAQAGGYSQVLSTATSRRNGLASQIANARSQIHLSYRNMTLVLRDAGRIAEAIATAQQALTYATDDERSIIESLIADLQRQVTP